MSGVSIPIRFWQSKEIKVEMDDNTHFILEFDNSCFFVISSHFIRGCSKDKAPEISAEHARHVIEIIQGVYDSARSGKAVELKTGFNYQH